MNEPTLLVVSVLMFIGAGPASTSGGIKVTTVAVLTLVLWSEVRGNIDVTAFWRRLPEKLIRQALAIVMLALGVLYIILGPLFVRTVTHHKTRRDSRRDDTQA